MFYIMTGTVSKEPRVCISNEDSGTNAFRRGGHTESYQCKG
jgi:hypothetical protein